MLGVTTMTATSIASGDLAWCIKHRASAPVMLTLLLVAHNQQNHSF